MKSTKTTWKKNEFNEVLERGDYFISYNPADKVNPQEELVMMMGAMMGFVQEDEKRQPETALVFEKDGEREYKILNGDFRKDYEKCKSLKECIAFFDKKSESYKSKWSN